jgi:S-ribosylhomocysteine lyase LuxS involved in autoinducer biosynthesis
MLRKTLGPKRDYVTGEWRKIHNEELNDLYCPPNIVRVIKSGMKDGAVHVACMGERRGAYMVLVGKPEVKSPNG